MVWSLQAAAVQKTRQEDPADLEARAASAYDKAFNPLGEGAGRAAARIAVGAIRLAEREGESCGLRQLRGDFAADLDGAPLVEFQAALLLGPVPEGIPVPVDLDAAQQQHRLRPLFDPAH